MVNLNNLSTYMPDENSIEAELIPLGISFLRDDEGNDWYKSQSRFKAETLKVVYGTDGVIYSADYDVSALWPLGMSVSEVKKSAVPEGFSIDGSWHFDGKSIIPAPKDHVADAEEEKSRRLAMANTAIAPLQDATELGMATEQETAQLQEWKKFRVLLSRVDPSKAPEIEWPTPPKGISD